MHRRQFLSTTLAASALSLAPSAEAQPQSGAASPPAPEFYELRRYRLTSGPQTALAETFFAEALIPALNRLGIAPIGTFTVDIGPETPTFYLLLPSRNLETLATAGIHLAHDEAFQNSPFWSAPASAPAFTRIESSLLRAFPGWPRLTPPDTKSPRIFQLRTYQSSSHAAHVRKVEMFHSGEFDIFARAGFGQVFFGDTLIGDRLPSLTYMLTFPDITALNARWETFRTDPAWKKLSSDPRFSYEAIVSNITNLILKPLPSSQI